MGSTREDGRGQHHVAPCIPGFNPDPSVCNINGTFYLVTSSFHLFPGLPIYSSLDLKTWKLVGHAINREDQISLKHSDTELPTKGSNTIATGGLWAPTIRHHAGTTYILCTNVVFKQGRTNSSRQNFIISTSDPESNDWSNPIYFDFDGIDPSIFFDENGLVYIQTCAHPRGGIWQFQFDINQGIATTSPKLLWEGWDQRFTEGPHIYKRHGYYYLFVAEGGTFENHMISVARSRSIHGPFTSCPSNPIFGGNPVKGLIHAGHGDLFQNNEGEWWTTFHGVRCADDQSPISRETFVAKVEWPDEGWPSVHRIIRDTSQALREEQQPLVFLRNAEKTNYSFSRDECTASLRASAVGLNAHKKSPTFIGKRQIHLHGQFSAKLRVSDKEASSVKAGICLYKDEHRFASIAYCFQTSRICFEAQNAALNFCVTATMLVIVGEGDESLLLRISYTTKAWTFLYATASPVTDWVQLGSVDSIQLGGRDFVGPIIGAFAVGPEPTSVYFEHIDL